MEAEAVLGLGAAFAASGLLLLMRVGGQIQTPNGKRVARVLGLGQIMLGAVLAAGAGLALMV